ncbi:MAG: RHS repeat-associated core domain-containing protein, partial [Cyclobacteriaceae bacterium]
KDHLGNVRAVVVHENDDIDEKQHTDYYPFGMAMTHAGSRNHRFGYQGNFAEYDEETGFNHFKLRDFDPVIGRFNTIDPAGQFWSPYTGMGNNPVIGIDPTGGICPTCPGGSAYDAYRDATQNFGYDPDIGVFNNDFTVVVLASRYFDVQKVGVFERLSVGDMMDMQKQLADVEAMMATFNPENVGTILFLAEGLGGNGKGPKKFNVTPRVVKNVPNITKLTKAGNYPSWNTVKTRYWKLMNGGKTPTGTAQVRMRATGEVRSVKVSKELHHINGRTGTDPHRFENLKEVWPWEHEAIDASRHTGYDFIQWLN